MTPHPRTRFSVRRVYRHRQPHIFHFAAQRYSFWVATFSLFAFVVGNMVGQHGWYAFWHSVFGRVDDSTIVFTGTVPPIAKVPDYERWAEYGGDLREHTYRMVPQDLLVSLPAYDMKEQKKAYDEEEVSDVYSMGHMGSYTTGAEGDGSHVGIDIRVPIGTPVQSVANGIVETVREVQGGFGKYVVIRHPNIPDAANKITSFYSTYAHLDAILISEGMVVQKGEHIANSGQTGYASGPHLHFQIDNEDAPFHPYWPFTSTEARDAHYTFAGATNAGLHQDRGYLYTVSPMLFVQEYAGKQTLIVQSGIEAEQMIRERKLTPRERALARRSQRASQLGQTSSLVEAAIVHASSASSDATENMPAAEPVATERIAQTTAPVPVHDISVVESPAQQVDTIAIDHDGEYKRGWEKVHVTTLDANGDAVLDPSFSGKMYLRAGFGEAEFRPPALSQDDFKDGKAVVHVLPRGSKRSLVIETRGAFEAESNPMEYVK